MNGWLIALLVIVAIYVLGIVGFFLWIPTTTPQRGMLALLWPLTVLWMIFGNIQ
jgi:hypothetical protein